MHLSQKNCPLSGLVFQNKAFDEEISLICAHIWRYISQCAIDTTPSKDTAQFYSFSDFGGTIRFSQFSPFILYYKHSKSVVGS